MTIASEHTTLKLLAAVDGSAHADAALRWIASLANIGIDLNCTLLHVQQPILAGEVGLIAPADVALAARERHTQEVIERAVKMLHAVPVTPVAETASDVAAALLACVQQHACDAIVVGRRGQGALRAALLGSVSAGVVQHASLPVIVINQQVQPVAPPLRIVLAADGSEAAVRAAACAARIAKRVPDGEVHVLHVRPDMTLAETILGPTERLIEQWSGATETQALDRARDTIEHTGATCAIFRVVAGDPHKVILREAGDLNAGMIAMGTRGLGPVSGLLAGSVALHVLQHARVPVLLAR